MSNDRTKQVATECAAEFGLPASLVLAIIKVESAFNPNSWRAEPHYRYLVDIDSHKPFRKLTTEETRSEKAPVDFPFYNHISSRDTEWWGQQASWGLMQVMGAVAREYKFDGPFPVLCSTDLGVYYGCKHLKALKERYFEKYGWEGVAAAYNAGSPRIYNDEYQNQYYINRINSALISLGYPKLEPSPPK